MVYAAEQDYQNEYLMGRKPVIRTGFDYYARQGLPGCAAVNWRR